MCNHLEYVLWGKEKSYEKFKMPDRLPRNIFFFSSGSLWNTDQKFLMVWSDFLYCLYTTFCQRDKNKTGQLILNISIYI